MDAGVKFGSYMKTIKINQQTTWLYNDLFQCVACTRTKRKVKRSYPFSLRHPAGRLDGKRKLETSNLPEIKE